MTTEMEVQTEAEVATEVVAAASEPPVVDAVAETTAIEASTMDGVADSTIDSAAHSAEEMPVYSPVVEASTMDLADEPTVDSSEVQAEAVDVASDPAVAEAVAETATNEASTIEALADSTVTVADTTPAVEASPVIEASLAADEAVANGRANETSIGSRVVRTLAVGQEVTGIVKRTSEFGAFIDIGVGRDGLVHVSELSTRRVAKVTDVLKEGQSFTFWIKELDRERNRISLTMISPGTKTVRTMQKGDIIMGTVTRIMPYGAFVDIGIGRDALLHVREMGERFVPKPEDVVTVGEEIEARVIEIERRRARVDLSVKGLRPEPEPEVVEPVQTQAQAAEAAHIAKQEAVEQVDKYADMPVMSAIEAAMKKAMSQRADEERAEKARKNVTNASAKARALQEEMLNRTMKSSN